MANRATRLADEHIRALNLIDLEFRQRIIPSKKDRAVISAWRDLFGELTQGLRDGETDQTVINAWNSRCNEFYVKLEAALALAVGFRFSDEELRRSIYYPRGHGEREIAQLTIMHNLKRLLEGQSAINMRVTELPSSPEAAAAQTALLEKISKAYTEDGAGSAGWRKGRSSAHVTQPRRPRTSWCRRSHRTRPKRLTRTHPEIIPSPHCRLHPLRFEEANAQAQQNQICRAERRRFLWPGVSRRCASMHPPHGR